MTSLDFLSPDLAVAEAVWRSPLERALREAPAGVEDLSRIGKIEARGDLGQLVLDVEHELVQVTPERALILCPYEDCGRVRASLPARLHPVDLTAALAGLRVPGQRAMRRLTDLDLRALPAVGPVARVRTVVLADAGDTYGLFFPQEYGDFMAEAVLDALEGAT